MAQEPVLYVDTVDLAMGSIVATAKEQSPHGHVSKAIIVGRPNHGGVFDRGGFGILREFGVKIERLEQG